MAPRPSQGRMADQAALHGGIEEIGALGLELIRAPLLPRHHLVSSPPVGFPRAG
jgi:hypothetical protein